MNAVIIRYQTELVEMEKAIKAIEEEVEAEKSQEAVTAMSQKELDDSISSTKDELEKAKAAKEFTKCIDLQVRVSAVVALMLLLSLHWLHQREKHSNLSVRDRLFSIFRVATRASRVSFKRTPPERDGTDTKGPTPHIIQAEYAPFYSFKTKYKSFVLNEISYQEKQLFSFKKKKLVQGNRPGGIFCGRVPPDSLSMSVGLWSVECSSFSVEQSVLDVTVLS